MPFRRFWIDYNAIRHGLALDRVNLTRALQHAIATAFAGKDAGTLQMTRDELAEAFLAVPSR